MNLIIRWGPGAMPQTIVRFLQTHPGKMELERREATAYLCPICAEPVSLPEGRHCGLAVCGACAARVYCRRDRVSGYLCCSTDDPHTRPGHSP